MENANSRDYLEKIKIQVIENLKRTAHAPSVQMQDVPRQPFGGMTEEEEAELDDLDEDNNKDVRHTQHRWDKAVTRDDELYESEDEDMNKMNGIVPQNNVSKSKNIMDYQNPNAVAEDHDAASSVPTPAQMEIDIPTPTTAEANAEIIAEVLKAKELDPSLSANGEIGTSNAPSRGDSPRQVDIDGDVDMDEPHVQATEQVPTPEAAIELATGAATVATPPLSPIAPQVQETTVTVTEENTPAAEPKTENDIAAEKDEGDAERDDEDVTAEEATEAAEDAEKKETTA
jgi:histone deacetylase 1/2